MSKRRVVLLFVLIVVTAVFAAFFDYPKWMGAKLRPWGLGLDLIGGSYLVYDVDMSKVNAGDRDSVMDGLKDVIERRVNLFGVSEPQVYASKSGDSYRLIAELAGISDVNQAIKEIGETPLLDFREVRLKSENGAGTGASSATSSESNAEFIPTALTGRFVSGAQLSFDSRTNFPEVIIEFNDEGANMFSELTGRNIGKPLAIFLDNALISMPVVQSKIAGGRAQISGNFTITEAKELVQRFNAGALPAPINLVSQQSIGATLGFESLKKIIIAGIIGSLAIAAFMILYYRLLGFFAVMALTVYIVFALAIFKLVGITMSLSGIAGFILSIGMAVDANILIFERVKEELRRGLLRVNALAEGFSRAWPSIRDSNVSTIITSLILYSFTSSFVRGFALTLFIGVLVSMFSAIIVTRTMLKVFSQ